MSKSDAKAQGSFSVYVPKDSDDPGLHQTYFRLGGGNPYSPEGDPYKDYDKNFGIYFYTDGDKKEVVKGKKKLDLKADGSKLISAEFDFDLAEAGMEHKAKWSRASSTEVSLSDKRTVSFGYTCSIGLSAAQEISAAMPFKAGLGPSVEAKLDPLGIAFSPSGMEVKSAIPKLKSFAFNEDSDTRAAKSVSMTAAAHDVPALAVINGLVITYQVAIGAVAAASAILMIVPMSGTSAVADEDGSKDDEVEDWLKALSITGVTMASLVTLLQAAGLVLGAVGIGMATAAKALDLATSGQVVVTPTRAQMRVGPTSFVEITPFNVVISAPTVRIHASQQANIPAPMPAVPVV